MTAAMGCELVGRWRIVEADLWDRAHLDLVEPASITIQSDGHGEIAFGAMQAGLDLEYGRTTVFFTWAGFDEMDDVKGSGSAELHDDGSLEIEFAYHLGDEAVLKAVRMTSSTVWLGQASPSRPSRTSPASGTEPSTTPTIWAGSGNRRTSSSTP